MMKREILLAGVLGCSLIAFAAGAAENAGQNAETPSAQPQVVEEQQSLTVVAVPCEAPAAAAKCPEKTACQPSGDACAAPSGKEGAADYSDDDYALAYEVLELTGIPENTDAANTMIVDAQMRHSPALHPAHSAFKEFFDRHCSYAAMKRDFARVHLEMFTRDELRKLAEFFRTPAGKKFAHNQAELMRRCHEIHDRQIHANLQELHRNVQKALDEAHANAPATNAQNQN